MPDFAAGLVVLVEERYRAQRQPAGMLAELARRGAAPPVLDPEHLVHDLGRPSWLAGTRVVVARGRSPALLTALAVAERFGVRTVNRSEAVAAVKDKAAMTAALVAAGIPTPRAWVGPPERLADLLEPADYPVVVKPVFGDNGRGVRLVLDAAAIGTGGPVVAQQYVPGDGTELKIYAAGNRLWGVRVPSLFGGGNGGAPGPVPVGADLAGLARACGRAFGLELYGVDCLVGPDGPVVVEVNDFPNYRGAEGSDAALATHVLSLAGATA